MQRGWLHLASGALLGRLFSFISNLFLSRWLGPTDLGIFNLATTTVQTGDTLVRCGADYSLNYEVGGRQDPFVTARGEELAKAFAQLVLVTTFILCSGLFIWLFFANGLFPHALQLNQRWAMSILLLFMVAAEAISAPAWEILLVSRQTGQLALRQGLFFPIRLILAACGSLTLGVSGAMAGWCIAALVQLIWLKRILKESWMPLNILAPQINSIKILLKRGLPFYGSNLFVSLLFYPILISVASNGDGYSDIGYLRIGQILQQLFAFLPATLVPVLFLELRAEGTYQSQVHLIEKPLRLLWLLLILALLCFCIVDNNLVTFLFGVSYLPSVQATRMMLMTALLESLSQLVVQPLLATGRTKVFGLCQNGSAITTALIIWFLIPDKGLNSYLFARLIYATLPLIVYCLPLLPRLHSPRSFISLVFATLLIMLLICLQAIDVVSDQVIVPLASGSVLLLIFWHRLEILNLKALLSLSKS